jgi:two-component system nitrate/nitrite response regulator NarL
MRILIADDHPIFVEALIGLLERDGVVASWQRAASFGEMVLHLQQEPDCALVLMDLDMPGVELRDAAVRLRALVGEAPLAVISGESDPNAVLLVQEAGFNAFLPKSLETRLLCSAIRLVVAGGSYFPRVEKGVCEAHERRAAGFSEREMAIIRFVADGRSNKQIARELGLQEVTIKMNLTRILDRTKLKNRTQLATFALKEGLVR